MNNSWNPSIGDKVLIQISGMEHPQSGTISWHGMYDSDWGGFSVTLDNKHPKFTQTIGPYRADKFKEFARPIPGQKELVSLLNQMSSQEVYNTCSLIAMPWQEELVEIQDLEYRWIRRDIKGGCLASYFKAHQRRGADKKLIEQGYILLGEYSEG